MTWTRQQRHKARAATAVLTAARAMKCPAQPCASCPWRLDTHADQIPNFDLTKAENLLNTTTGELMAPMMACHMSQEGDEFVCAGWLARHGRDSIFAWIAVIEGRLPAAALDPKPGWPAIHDTYQDVLDKLRADCAADETNMACDHCGSPGMTFQIITGRAACDSEACNRAVFPECFKDDDPPSYTGDEPLGTCVVHGDYWTDDCTRCTR